jgi:hypothetical protein
VDLWPRVDDPGVSRERLLQRLRQAAERADRDAEELAAVNELLALIDTDREPLTVASLLVSRARLRYYVGEVFTDPDNLRLAVTLSARYPHSPEHALATAMLADALLWQDDAAGVALAYQAVHLATACDSEQALGHALIARAYARLRAGTDGGTADGLWAWDIAVRWRDFALLTKATYVINNTLDAEAGHQWVDMFHRAHTQLSALDAPHTYISEMCAQEAAGLLVFGDWRRCTAKLRVALGTRPSAVADARVRLTAAALAARQGRRQEAEAHLARADELFRERSSFTVFNFEAVRVELATAAGDTDRAVSLALTALGQDPPVEDAEWLLQLAARALADRAVALRDDRQDAAAAVRRLRDLRDAHPTGIVDATNKSRWYRRLVGAMQELADAETARGLGSPDQAANWHRAAIACHDAEIRAERAPCTRTTPAAIPTSPPIRVGASSTPASASTSRQTPAWRSWCRRRPGPRGRTSTRCRHPRG